MRPTSIRILVPTDFSDGSADAVDRAAIFARQFGASLHVLHVIDDRFVRPTRWESQVYIGNAIAIRDALIDRAAMRVAALLKRVKERGVRARGEVRIGRAAEVIRDVATSEAVDVIVRNAGARTVIAVRVLESGAGHKNTPHVCSPYGSAWHNSQSWRMTLPSPAFLLPSWHRKQPGESA
jgi:nucleotide-binding universal stress UspA family protein